MKQILLFSFLLLSAPAAAQVSIGSPAPDFSLIVLDTQAQDTVTLSDLQGKVVYIFFYGAGCPHCQSNGPFTETEIHQTFVDEENFVALGLDTWNYSESSNRSFRSTTGITYTLLLNARNTLVDYYGTASAYDRSAVIAADGTMAYRGTGFVNSDYVAVNNVIETELAKIATSSEASSENPTRVSLHQNYPNPFNPSTTISFDLDASSQVSLKVYNVLGSEVATITNGFLSAGNHSFSWNASAFPSGVYMYRLFTENGVLTRKMMLLK